MGTSILVRNMDISYPFIKGYLLLYEEIIVILTYYFYEKITNREKDNAVFIYRTQLI